ncbi:MAG: hypothetical protein CTY16_20190 [Methylobacter sp.]|nr:MAG: hypothetical protein CTY16_20190 [Methylobacter sp.]
MTIKLTNDKDIFLGKETNKDDIDGLGGDDTLDGGAGDDILFGNLGNDLIAGGSGADLLKGGDGDDVLDGGTENDIVNGDAGNDIGYGGAGADTLNGGSGNDYLFGGSEKDKLFGGSGSDALYGADGDDSFYDTDNMTIYGLVITEKDEMIGGAGNDSFYGGYDVMWGNEGNDFFNVKNQGTVYGGVGNDIVTVNNTTNPALGSVLEGGLGNDTLTAGVGKDVLFSGYGADILNGGAGDDSYVITFDDVVDKDGKPVLTGIDKISDTGGIDTVFYIRDFAGDGRDDDIGADGKELGPLATDITFFDQIVTLAANIENGVLDDQIYVNNPDVLSYSQAWLTGNTLNNIIKGSNLNDILDGAVGNDIISAGDGDDFIFAGQGTDTIDGGAGKDTIAASVNFNLATQAKNVENIDLLDGYGGIDKPNAISAWGNANNNILYGNKFNNKLYGGAGDDTLDGLFYSTTYSVVKDKSTGNDELRGEAGNDFYRIDSAEDLVIETSITTGGTDTVEFSGAIVVNEYVLTAGVENLIMKSNLTNGTGNNLNNRIIGNSSANNLKGGYGDDFLDGSGGTDKFEGGYGDDTFVVDSTSEVITEFDGQGNDWVQSATISLDLNTPNWGGSIENAKLTGTTGGDVTGNTVNNYLIGNDGGNVLDGRGGKDTLAGGKGDDIYYVDTTTDIFIEGSGEGTDTIQSDVNFTLASLLNFENLSLSQASLAKIATGNSNNNLIKGNNIANTLSGLDGNDTFDGGAGLDTLIGGKGDDVYRLSNDGDVITELANEGNDTIEVSTTFSLLLSSLKGNVENLTLNGIAAADGTGTNGANKITGNSAANLLTGLAGTDTLVGGEGTDTLIGGLGADVLNLTESLAKNDIVRIALGDSVASVSEADRVVKFGLLNDTLDLAGTIKIRANASAADGTDVGGFKSHSVINGIIKFDDVDSYAIPVSITATNISGVIDYLKFNITDGSIVAFQGTAPDPSTTTGSAVSSTWVFQDNGANDTLVALVGVTTATSLSTGGFSSTAIHLA